MHINKYKIKDGYSYRGIEYDTPEELLGEMLSFCGCGEPIEALLFVMDCLNSVEEGIPYIFQSYGAKYFVWYMLTDKGLIDHGGTVPGYLTPYGKEILDDLLFLYPLLAQPKNTTS